MGARNSEPLEKVRVLLSEGVTGTVSAEQARRCHYRVLDDSEANDEATPSKPDAAVVRAWAKENDVDCPQKGRVPASVFEAYEQAN